LTDELLHDVFAASAKKWPTRVALRCGDKELTYRELRQRASMLARYLRRLGVGSGDAVVIWLPRGLEMYVALLGILEAGAYYVPMDPDFPVERVAFTAQDCQARVLVTTRALLPVTGEFQCQAVRFDDEQDRIAAEAPLPLRAVETGVTPDHLAYMIYTSGTSGRPKGVMIPHRAIRHFVFAEGSVVEFSEKDVVAQSASLSFDLSQEEIWLSLAAGATILIVTKQMLQAGGGLGRLLTRQGVTVWSTVPTLLAMQEADIPALRLVIVGGEPCPPELVRRWAKPGRRLLNTYGPTETTITATWCELLPDKAVTIGQPLPNYTAYVLDELRQPVPRGESGELCIGGPGVASGYLNRPKLTAEKFIENPFAGANAPDPMLYRTGDLVSVNADGDIEFLGRIDTQVKIRGYRVELAEIESVLIELGQLRTAVAALQPAGEGGDPVLVAYLVPREGTRVEEAELRERCREKLPAYMVPTLFQTLPQLPTMPSGKVDRTRLPPIGGQPAGAPRREAPVTNPTEKVLYDAWAEIFEPAPVSLDDDFFLDLGGHSLRAAALVSKLRKHARFNHVSMRDIYDHPTIRRLAEHLGESGRKAEARTEEFHATPWWRYTACTVAQGVSLIPIFAFYSLQLLIPYLGYAWFIDTGSGRAESIGWSLLIFLLSIPAMLVFSVAVKWVVLGQTRPGVYPLWGSYYFRWWLVRRVLGVVPTDYLTGTPLLGLYFRLLGAKIGDGVHLDSDALDAADLVEMGNGSSAGNGASLVCARVENGQLKLGRILIGAGCHIGNGSVVGIGAVMRDRARLGELSLLPAGAVIPAGEEWAGSPAVKVGLAPPPAPLAPLTLRIAHGLIFGGMFFVFPVLAILPIFPGMMLLTEMNEITDGYDWLLLSPILALGFIVTMCLEIAVLKWLVLGKVRAGSWAIYSDYYVRYWFVDKLMELSLDIVNSLYATLYLNPWYKLLGVKVGTRAEVSTASSMCHDLLDLGDECFIADAVLLGAPRVCDGRLELLPTKIGRRAFVGNSALVPAGTVIGEDVLVGVLSVPPRGTAEAAQVGSSWFGTPAIFLPRRQLAQQFDEGSTFRPSQQLVAQRYMIEALRVLLPPTVYIAMNSLLISCVLELGQTESFLHVAVQFPFMYMALALLASLGVVAMKWIVIGRYKPSEKPLWSRYVWRSELVTSTYENVAAPLFCEHLEGTPFLNLYLRLLGAKIGRRVYMDTSDITEFDVVSVGDDAALNEGCGLQTHLFEDRVMKISTVEIGAGCSIGASAVVLYDSVMEPGSSLDDLSMLMKGETLPANTAWQGSPARKRKATGVAAVRPRRAILPEAAVKTPAPVPAPG
jgi:non-ribosomal peptide synthetase-like protein